MGDTGIRVRLQHPWGCYMLLHNAGPCDIFAKCVSFTFLVMKAWV